MLSFKLLPVAALLMALSAVATVPILADFSTSCDMSNVANQTAVAEYLSALSDGRIGDAIIHRYAFDNHVQEDGTLSSTNVSIESTIMTDIENLSEDYDFAERAELLSDMMTNSTVNDNLSVGLRSKIFNAINDEKSSKRKRDSYTTKCYTSHMATYVECSNLVDEIPNNNSGIGDANVVIYSYGNCHSVAVGKNYMSGHSLNGETSLIIDDCQRVSCGSCVRYLSGLIAGSSNRRKVCVSNRTTGC